MATQPASTSDGLTKSNLKGQVTDKRIDVRNPVEGAPSLKGSRETGKNAAGTDYLRKNQMGAEPDWSAK